MQAQIAGNAYPPEGSKAKRVGWVQILWKYNMRVGNKNYKKITILLN